MKYDLLFLRDGMRLVMHRESPSPWSARERDIDGVFVLREGVEIPLADVLAMYPPPTVEAPPIEDDAPFPAEVVEAAVVTKPKAKPKPRKKKEA